MPIIGSDNSFQSPPLDTSEWEARLGGQVRVLRLEVGHDQAELADLANVSVSAVQNLENGRGSSLRTLIRVLRALEATDWLTTLATEPTISPLDVLRSSASSPRKRVYRPRGGA